MGSGYALRPKTSVNWDIFLNDEFIVFQIEEHLHFLHTSYKDVVAEKQQLAYRKKLATKRLQCASVLLTVLEDEKARPPLASDLLS